MMTMLKTEARIDDIGRRLAHVTSWELTPRNPFARL